VTLDGVKVMMDNGWFILRASNTTPVVRLVAEAGSENALDNIVKYAMGEFRKAEESLQLG
ncbi:MAG TPA: phosphomannomutase/phosphoglucomutase, partial [Candidatus Saccharimonadales bacterium]|nr:phosphomannomutase/phosphoglucomutase [Candidatus Saccharimonadales bacterium]